MTKQIARLTLAVLAFAMSVNAADLSKMITITTAAKIRSVTLCGETGLAAGFTLDGAVYVWRLSSGETVNNRDARKGTSALACSPDGKWLALGSDKGSVMLTDLAGRSERTLAIGSEEIRELEFSPDATLLAVQVGNSPAQLWDAAQGTAIAVLKNDFGGSTSMDFSPDSSLLAVSNEDTSVKIYDRKGNLKATNSDLLLEPFGISFTADGKQLVVGGADCLLTILNATDGRRLRQLAKVDDPIFHVAALPDGSLLSLQIDAAALKTFTLNQWDLRTGGRQALSVDASKIVGGGTTEGRKWVLFTADSDSSLTAWTEVN
jgi:WD40 repeat protein